MLHGVRVRTPRPWPLPQRPTALADLLGPGVTRTMVATQLRYGRLVRVREGVYVAASAWPDDAAQRHVGRARAEQVLDHAAVISHHSAGLAWGLPQPPLAHWEELPPTLTRSREAGHRCRSHGGVQLLAARLPEHHVILDPEGWAITSLARTAVDVANGLDLPDALVVLDGAARSVCANLVGQPRRRDYANPALQKVVRENLVEACLGRRGMSGVRAAIELADPRRESAIESLTAAHIHLAGLPMPEFQVPIRTPLGTFYPDCYWKDHRLIGEADGAGKYTGPGVILQEKEREQVFHDLDYGVVRWLGKEITFRPAVVMDRIARALDLTA